MKPLSVSLRSGNLSFFCSLILLLFSVCSGLAQTCPTSGTSTISSYPNTYYPANQASVPVGTTSIALGTVTYGTTPISSGDIVLIIQMQGAYINASNDNNYGAGTGTGSGYITDATLYAGMMEYGVATNSVPLSGGTLNLKAGTVNAYSNAAVGRESQQYTYQVIRIPLYFNLQLTGTITAPAWDGIEGGVVVLRAQNNLDLNGQTVDASGQGFRGAGGRAFRGDVGGTYTDYVTYSSSNFNGGKGEGLAGTPMYLNYQGSLYAGTVEGYSNGSYAQGAPGNAGGGGTDGNPSANDQNTGGGGGGNGGQGGQGGYAWSSGLHCGGKGGAAFAQVSPSRLVMGGGGGGGTNNDGTGTPSGGVASGGATGGGILILYAANAIIGSGSLLANGQDANNTVQNDGSGGGGAAGAIIIYSNNGVTSNITAHANGGKGGNNQMSGGPSHGPGGGGGGGVIYSNASLAAGSSVSAGAAGTTSGLRTTYGASAGSPGSMIPTLKMANLPSFPLQCAVLAVNFLDVTARRVNDVVNVQWHVALEVNTAYYLVERSTDGLHFSTVANIPYQQGVASGNAYQFDDQGASALSGMAYYRIRETDVDGAAIYSKIVSVQLNSLPGTFSVYPNPARNYATVSFSLAADATVSLRLFDLKGKEVWLRQYQASAGPNTLQIDGIRALPAGVYILQWFDKTQPQELKILVAP